MLETNYNSAWDALVEPLSNKRLIVHDLITSTVNASVVSAHVMLGELADTGIVKISALKAANINI